MESHKIPWFQTTNQSWFVPKILENETIHWILGEHFLPAKLCNQNKTSPFAAPGTTALIIANQWFP